MVTLAAELLTRLVPYGQDEATYARNRLPAERPPWPQVGDRVWFRRDEWDTDEQLHEMRVVDVQDPDDTDSVWASNLWQHLRSNFTGEPLFHRDGRPVLVPLPDPLPWVHLRWPDEYDIPKGHSHDWKYRAQQTWESRMRGSPGWLPWDYRDTRRIHLTGQVPQHGLIAYRYDLAADRVEQMPPEGDVWLPYP